MRALALLATLTLLLAGCASGPQAQREDLRYAEDLLQTGSEKVDFHFHAALEDIQGLGLQFPGFLIGVEKTDRTLLGLAPRDQVKHWPRADVFAESGLQEFGGPHQPDARIRKLLDDRERTFVSHIIEYRLDNSLPLPRIRPEQPLFNAYDDPRVFSGRRDTLALVQPPQLYSVAEQEMLTTLKQTLLDRVRDARNAGRPYSHILVYSMGWNTGQSESIQNYNSLLGHLLNAGPPSNFKPLFIGFSWPSAWSFGTSLRDRIWRAMSVLNKGNDADEVGLVWANRLIHQVLPDIKRQYNLKLVLVGHSYGARLLSRALFSCRLLPNTNCQQSPVDLLVGLQGAFSRSRYSDLTPADDRHGGRWVRMLEEIGFYREGQPHTVYLASALPTKQVFLYSKYDAATSQMNFIGGGDELVDAMRRPPHDAVFEFGAIDANANATPLPNGQKVLLLDAQQIVHDDLPQHGGGAHSDIYNPEIGQVLNQLIQHYAPN